jgi:Ribbon-helix-helix protein, copG family
MRTTVTLDDDVAAAVRQLREERNIGPSEAINELARAGFRRRQQRQVFRQDSFDLGLRIDVSNVAEAVELLEDDETSTKQ